MKQYNPIAETEKCTVVAKYEPEKKRSDQYQSEAALEKQFIHMLGEQGYTYLQITDSKDLKANLRAQLEKLNKYWFTDREWERFFTNNIANSNEGIVEKTRKLQEDAVQVLKRDDGTTKNITLIDKKVVHNNTLQVINQYVENSGNEKNRYDVTILVNGFPMIHVELKRRGVAIKEAFNQIDRYQRDSFWAGDGLYEYVQIFVISNGTHTKYYSNTTRMSAINEKAKNKKKKIKTSNSFEFTSFWADAKNKIIPDLVDFTKTFFAKHTLLNIITKYCILTSENLLLVMRPYQIVATEKIINRIEVSTNSKMTGTIDGGGFIWHTTGSGKTLTSFKAAQIASRMPEIDKVIFVVDRKDLDYQTMKEYDRFEKGAANGNKNTKTLQRQLENKTEKGGVQDYRIIVTTIQKLDRFIAKNPKHDVYDQHIVMIFDECHRSQFGEMHQKIVKHFKRYHIFGFTGTPIFPENASGGGKPDLKTTEQVFGTKLHTYTIVDAINDGNVLPFRIDYVNTMKAKGNDTGEKVSAIDTESALLAPERITEVVDYIIQHFDQKTKRNHGFYSFNKTMNIGEVAGSKTETKEDKLKVKLNGFNAIFAVSSIEAAQKYYLEFKKQFASRTEAPLKIATIYSYGQNEDDPDGFIDDENSDSTEGLDVTSRQFLEMAIADYNKMFGTAYDTSADKFPNYYKDLSLRMKNREVDLLIVVNMFLTGFDATTLNTLWVDKNLKMHGLIQAFSRTNRILNSVKTYGNIICFRDLDEATNNALKLFGDKNASGIVLLKSYNDYYYGYEDDKGKFIKGYEERIAELIQKYPLGTQLIGKEMKKAFVRDFGNILRLRNILLSFDQFTPEAQILSPIDFQDYTGIYVDLHDELRPQIEKENIEDDIIFEMELVKQVEVDIDYILMLVQQYHDDNCKDKEILGAIDRAVKSSPELRSKKELIDQFVTTVNVNSNVQNDWKIFVETQRETDIENLIAEEKLKEAETRKLIDHSFRDGELKISGTAVDQIMPAMSRFGGGGGNRIEKKKNTVEKLKAFFDKYFGLI